MKPGSLCVANGKLYAVRAGDLLEIDADWRYRVVGSVVGGNVTMRANETQLLVLAVPNAYVYDFAAETLDIITGEWSDADVLDGYGVLLEKGTSQFFVTAVQDFKTINPLSYASTEGNPGPNIAILTKHRELLILKDRTGEVWYDSGAADFPMSRNDGAPLEVGCSAFQTLQKLGGVAYWLGRDSGGQAVVFAMPGYIPQRISSHALEEALTGLDLSEASAFAYHQEGLSFYCLNVPGLDTTWVFEVASGIWHERAEWVDGAFRPWRPVCHAHFNGIHVVGDADDNLYELDPETFANGADVLIRDLITPHTAVPTLERMRVSSVQLNCDVATSSTTERHLLMRYSDDGGRSWSNWRVGSLGDVGRTKHRVRWTMLGSARDRVWHFRVTDPVMCNLISAVFNER